jgi:hypothetical protein
MPCARWLMEKDIVVVAAFLRCFGVSCRISPFDSGFPLDIHEN